MFLEILTSYYIPIVRLRSLIKYNLFCNEENSDRFIDEDISHSFGQTLINKRKTIDEKANDEIIF